MHLCRCARPNTEADDLPTINEAEMLDEEFQCYLRVAKSLKSTFKRPKDVEICSALLEKCEELNESSNLEVKQHTNNFLKYALKVFNWTSDNQPLDIYERWYASSLEEQRSKEMETSIWLQPNKSYMAMKELSNGTVIIYCAAATNQSTAGWEEGAFKYLKDQNTSN